ncbi:MAG: hypothetical protein KGS72_09510 [Cyanobacteria bacterium REEB67]|nr:hypothetical protein [Cyanobacteria bacterium REEB67]
MKHLSILLFASLLLPQAALADQPAQNLYRAPTSFAGKTVVLPIGTAFEGRIQSTIGSRVSHAGQAFTIEISAPVMANGTEVLIPSGSEVVGEVAEAISSSEQPHDKNAVKPLGILRIQLSSIKMPDGRSYPLVASFATDAARSHSKGGIANMAPRKSSVAYVGTQAGFDSVNPANRSANRRTRNGVMSKSDILRDPILGDSDSGGGGNNGVVRSLIRKGRELYIMSGSSITIKLDAPLKIALGASSAQTSLDATTPDEPVKGGRGKHFSKTRQAQSSAESKEDSSQSAPASRANVGNGPSSTGGGVTQGAQTAPTEQPGSSF